VPVERIIKRGRKREGGEEGKREEKERKRVEERKRRKYIIYTHSMVQRILSRNLLNQGAL
jgi:hypothetical protein